MVRVTLVAGAEVAGAEVAGALAGLAGWGVSHLLHDLTLTGRGGATLTCVAAGSVIALVYFVGLRVLHVQELRSLGRRFGRVGRLLSG